jgi:hypothetical protein
MANGNALIVQLGKESTYGTHVTPTRQIRVSSESLKPNFNKVDEGLLTGNKGKSATNIMGIKVEGSLSTLARPDDIGLFLACALGEEEVEGVSGSDTVYKHTFTPVGNGENDNLPTMSAVLDRVVSTFGYSGLAIGSLSLSADAGDYVNLEASFVGKDEVSGTSKATLTPSPLKAFKFHQGKVYIKKPTDQSAVELADVTSVSWEYNNNLDSDTQTTSTGLYYKRPEVGTREMTTTLSCIYTSASEAYRNDFYKTDAQLGVVLEFTSDEEVDDGVPYSLKITIPCNQVTDADANVSGAERLMENMTLDAIDDGINELVTVELINGYSVQY